MLIDRLKRLSKLPLRVILESAATLSTAMIASGPRTIAPSFLAVTRCVVALVWLYEGLWLKIIAHDPHQLAIVKSFAFGSFTPFLLMTLIGGGETLLGLAVLSGLYWRFIAWFQGVLLVVMNITGILFGGGQIAQPIGLLIHNLPLLLCIALLSIYGPGEPALKLPGRR